MYGYQGEIPPPPAGIPLPMSGEQSDLYGEDPFNDFDDAFGANVGGSDEQKQPDVIPAAVVTLEEPPPLYSTMDVQINSEETPSVPTEEVTRDDSVAVLTVPGAETAEFPSPSETEL